LYFLRCFGSLPLSYPFLFDRGQGGVLPKPQLRGKAGQFGFAEFTEKDLGFKALDGCLAIPL
jgi:hypothetical protein